ncbi:hypothetical protein EYF80_027323 [Liparis tanakae]|uniref:Uncharacterized protein n=1 Tax=Liparis tanakae TaxID=230148 RepID=A0A4Z2HAY0_9TELE|nr:hypothetical protein EYF80_027323 [Liparis tanakae]
MDTDLKNSTDPNTQHGGRRNDGNVLHLRLSSHLSVDRSPPGCGSLGENFVCTPTFSISLKVPIQIPNQDNLIPSTLMYFHSSRPCTTASSVPCWGGGEKKEDSFCFPPPRPLHSRL